MKHANFPFPSLAIAILMSFAILGCTDPQHGPAVQDTGIAGDGQLMGAVFQTLDNLGRFNQVTLSGGAKIEDGCLVLSGHRPTLLARIDRDDPRSAVVPTEWSKSDPVPASVVQSARLFREKLLDDPFRPGYHFCIPEDNGRPGDANGCFYANGRYHLMYLYNRNGVGCRGWRGDGLQRHSLGNDAVESVLKRQRTVPSPTRRNSESIESK